MQLWFRTFALLVAFFALVRPVPSLAQSLPYVVNQDITYCTVGGVDLKLDIYTPRNKTTPMPLVVYIHGGKWEYGDKTDIVTQDDTRPTLNALTSAGYVVASVNYRLAPQYQFPAMIEDVKCAVRYFRATGAAHGIDTTRIVAWGSSAGGHLAALLGTADASAGWEVGQYLDESSRVESVVDWFGPTDLWAFLQQEPADASLLQAVFGATDRTTMLAASPVTYVTSDDSPTLLQHGVDDTEVPPAQSQELYNDLVAANVAATLQWVQNAGHQFSPVPATATISPSLTQIAQQVVTALNAWVWDNPAPGPQ